MDWHRSSLHDLQLLQHIFPIEQLLFFQAQGSRPLQKLWLGPLPSLN